MFYNVKKGTDRLTDWHTDGRWVQYLSEYVYNVKKGILKIRGKSFLKICQTIFFLNAGAQWKRVGLYLQYHF